MATTHVIKPMGKIHPRSVKGRFRLFKSAVMLTGFLTYFILPWLPWQRTVGANQALMFDLVTRKFYVFDLVIHAQDIFWLAGMMFLASTLLFFSTAVAGRLFCGYFCFQTLWTDAFRLIEKTVQGDRIARIRLDKAPWHREKLLKMGLTHALWLLLAFMTGLSFALYWGYAPQILADYFTGQAHPAAYITSGILMATTYLAAGFMRENICVHICPYARFQSVMIDKNTKIITYDATRGEGEQGRAIPTKALRAQSDRQAKGHGDCVDCGLCVQVCPTGIDIRQGLQLPCIQCGLCIDACDGIMDKQGWNRGLIRYASENELEGKPTKTLRMSSIGYGLAVLASLIFTFTTVLGKSVVNVSVTQVRNPLYITLSDGRIQNRYSLKVDNNSELPARFELTLQGLSKDVVLDMGKLTEIYVMPDASQRIMIKVKQQKDKALDSNALFQFILSPKEGAVKEPMQVDAHFISAD